MKVSRARAKPPIFQLKEGLFTVGSAPQCDLVIAEQTVSRKHVTLEVCPEGVIVTDLGSRNGTFYLGHRIQKVTLSAPREATPGAPSAARTGKARPPGPRTAPAETAPAHAPPNPYKKQ